MIETSIVASGQVVSVNSPRGFAIRSVVVDNNTNQWYQLDGTTKFIPAYTQGTTFSLPGVGSIRLVPETPFQGTSQPSVIAGEIISVSVSDQPAPPAAGTPYNQNTTVVYGMTDVQMTGGLFDTWVGTHPLNPTVPVSSAFIFPHHANVAQFLAGDNASSATLQAFGFIIPKPTAGQVAPWFSPPISDLNQLAFSGAAGDIAIIHFVR